MGRSVGIRSTLPVLDNVLLSVNGSKLKIAATNLEIGVIKFASIEKGEDGEVTVSAKTLIETVSTLKQAKIEISSDGGILHITSSKFKASLNGIPASEFPVIPLGGAEGIEFESEVLASVAQILFAAAVDEGRPVLTGILTSAKEGVIDFVATDGFRLAHRQVKVKDTKLELNNLIPRRTFEEIIRVISEDSPDKVRLLNSKGQNQAVFDFGTTLISSRLIEGSFPAWEKIIPTQIISRVVLDKEELLKAIKLAAIFAKNEANVIVLDVSKSGISLESAAKELGSQHNEIEGSVEGETLKIAFNAKFLSDAISNAPSSQLMLEFSGPLSPALVKGVGEEGLEFIIMPVRLS